MGQAILGLGLVDARSKWVEATSTTSFTSGKTTAILRGMFDRYGLPEQLVSDNGPQFASAEFETFANLMA